MSNHLHLVVIPRPKAVDQWTDEQVTTSALIVQQRPSADAMPENPEPNQVRHYRQIPDFVAKWRKRFKSVSWFMRLLNEHIARCANAEDNVTGHFWEGRFTSVPLLDHTALYACMAYVDLNPVRAAICESNSNKREFTSIQDRLLAAIDQVNSTTTGGTSSLDHQNQAQNKTSHSGAKERHRLLLPLESCQPEAANDWPIISTADYLELVTETGKYLHEHKRGQLHDTTVPERLVRVLHLNPDEWCPAMQTPSTFKGRAIGHRKSLAKECARTGKQWIQRITPLFRTEQLPQAITD